MLQKRWFFLWILIAGISLAVMSIALFRPHERDGAFIPPAFESEAVEGVPEGPEHLGYAELYQEGMAYRVGVCGRVQTTEGEAVVFFTNLRKNGAWLKLRLLDEQGNLLGESGLLKPGEYLRAVKLERALPAGAQIKLHVMGYQPDTYRSIGAVTLNAITTT